MTFSITRVMNEEFHYQWIHKLHNYVLSFSINHMSCDPLIYSGIDACERIPTSSKSKFGQC